MSTTVVDLFKAASQLDEADRATLAGLLLESLDQPRATWNQVRCPRNSQSSIVSTSISPAAFVDIVCKPHFDK
jgi:hypothetical protein